MTKVVGYSHWQYIEEEILNPLNLNNTYTPLDDVDADDVMSGYWVGYEPDLKNDPHGVNARHSRGCGHIREGFK